MPFYRCDLCQARIDLDPEPNYTLYDQSRDGWQDRYDRDCQIYADDLSKIIARHELQHELLDAIFSKSGPEIQAVLDKGADPDYTFGDGTTPLGEAEYFERAEAARILIQAGATNRRNPRDKNY
jgi:ankyrin repeat protein